MEKAVVVVLIVGAGPSGLATSACLNHHSIPNIILEREDCSASLWKKRSYDRVNLHLRKQFCQLPYMPHSPTAPNYLPKKDFIKYLDDYVAHFKLSPIYNRTVESAIYDRGAHLWRVRARINGEDATEEEYEARFLVVASGENCDPFVPPVSGLDTFGGEVVHSSRYKTGTHYGGKTVLVVGSGNSGMEIALDLCNLGARTSVVVRSGVHALSKEMVYWGLLMLRVLPLYLVDSVLIMLSKLYYGDLSEYGISRPTDGPLYQKIRHGKYPVIDVGTLAKIKSGEIQVFPALTGIKGNEATFANGKSQPFDAIVFATGYKRATNQWLKDDDLLNEDGIPKESYPNHWKGKNGLYCVGLTRMGVYGLSSDAINIANDIKMTYHGAHAGVPN